MPSGTIVISREAVKRLKHGHPWVYDNEIVDVQGARGGDVVRILGENGWSYGVAFFSDSSPVTLRRIDHREIFLDADFLRSRIVAAQQVRNDLLPEFNTYRLVNGEADGLPGIFIDKYGNTMVVQTVCQGSDAVRDDLLSVLDDEYAPARIVLRNDHELRDTEGLAERVEVHKGDNDGLVTFWEEDLQYACDTLKGQNTGAYLDQRTNRLLTKEFAHGVGLDLGCYIGGFSLPIARSCSQVFAIDNSAQAVALAKQNAQANHLSNIEWMVSDIDDYLDQARSNGDTFDTIICDPPPIGSEEGRLLLMQRIFRVAQVGAYLMLFQRQQPTKREAFQQLVVRTAAETGRRVQLLSWLGPSWDHPTLATMPETETFVGVLARVV